MASKSRRHKSENRFVFQTFYDRLSKINIDVIRRFGKFSAAPDDADTFFAEALKKWSDINQTQHFVNFRKQILGEVQSLPQLLHHQNDIIQVLQKHLQVDGSMALQPLLDLVVQLARDLQADFYPYFKGIFHTLLRLLNKYHHEVEILEQMFTCLAYLFKFQWKHMLKDINNVFLLFIPIMGKQYREYIHTFAAESFAFLMRKHKDPSGFIDFMLDSLSNSDDMETGTAYLLFEMIKGIQHQFHSSAEMVLMLLLSKVGVKKFDNDKVEEFLLILFQSIASHTTQLHSKFIWDVLLAAISDTHSQLKADDGKVKPRKVIKLNTLLSLLHVMVVYKQGSLLAGQDSIVQILLDLMKNSSFPEECAVRLLGNISALILGGKCELSAQHRPNLVNQVYSSGLPHQSIIEFTISVFHASLFEKDLLPGLLRYCHKCLQTQHSEHCKDVLTILARLVLDKVRPITGLLDLDNLPVYTLDFHQSMKSTPHGSFPALLLSMLDRFATTMQSGDLLNLWAILLCLPHVRPLDAEQVIPHLVSVSEFLLNTTMTSEVNAIGPDWLLVLQQAIIVWYRLAPNKKTFYEKFPVNKLISLLIWNPRNVEVLRIAELYMAGACTHNKNIMTEPIFMEVFNAVQKNFSSPYSQVRLLTSRILSQFNMKMRLLPADMEISQIGLFRIIMDVEECETTYHTYRDKLLHLRKLSHDIVTYQLPIGPFDQVPLRYLSSILYVNLSLLWKPVMELIATHAKGMPRQEFWDIYGELLEQAADQAEIARSGVIETDLTVSPGDSNSELADLMTSVLTHISTDSDRPDHLNYRNHLWRAMQLFPEVCETKSKIISPLFFRFLENEYYLSELDIAPVQNICSDSKVNPDDDTAIELDQSQLDEDEDGENVDISQSEDLLHEAKDQDQNEEIDLKETDEIDFMETDVIDMKETDEISPDVADGSGTKKKRRKSGHKMKRKSSAGTTTKPKRRRATNKNLIDHVTIFSKLKNPKSLVMEQRLYQFYLQLLQHKDSVLQKLAFDCLMTYKLKYLTPYEENFEKLIDESTFKDEIVLFSLDESTTVVKADHRTELLPVLLRILYGKMQHKVGRDMGGRASSTFRKSIVFRFLGGLTRDELTLFLNMVFEPWKDYLTGSLKEKVHEVMQSADPSCILPLRRQEGVLKTIEMLMNRIGSQLEHYLPNIIQLVSCIGGLCTTLLEHRDYITPYAVTRLKNIRNNAIYRINQFYNNFDYYKLSEDETSVFFEIAVWPQLEKLPVDGVNATTPLLKLFKSWSDNVNFYPLLGYAHPDNPSLTPLPYIFRLLHAPKVKSPVVSMVIGIIQRLLDSQESPESQAMEIDGLSQEQELYGIKLLMPYVDTILAYLKTVASQLTILITKKVPLPTKELDILSKLSNFVTDEKESTRIVWILIPFLGHQVKKTERVLVDVLKTVLNLIHRAEKPDQFLVSLAPLFSHTSLRASRTALCDIVKAIAEKVPEVGELANIVAKINSYDVRMMDEPDYLTRLSGFDGAKRILEESDDMTFILLLLHNCFFFLTNIDDLSIRSTTSDFIQRIMKRVSQLSEHPDAFRIIIEENIQPELKAKLKHKQEVVRHEYIGILATLVELFPDYPQYTDLAVLRDKVEIESDFFRNIVHIQQHRRARALGRVVRMMTTRQFQISTMVNYFLPMTATFIRDPIYVNAQHIQKAAIETIAAVCKQLPWENYVTILKMYLGLMMKTLQGQKLYVRIIIAILDAFHFDLRNSSGVKAAHLSNTGDAGDNSKSKNPEDADAKSVVDAEEDVDMADIDSGSKDDVPVSGLETVFDPNTPQICPEELATSIHTYIVRIIIPRLHKSLTQKAKSDDEHKKANAGKYAEDDEILRVPLALAMVKLLQRLPMNTMQNNLPGILVKVSNFLKSRSMDIRQTSRDTLNKILVTLGPKYFHYVVKELKETLTRGYMKHVLCYTIWYLMKNLRQSTDGLKCGDLDHTIPMLVEICNEELFGEVADEKEVDGITSKLMEAKTSKSLNSYGIMARYVSKESMAHVVKPLVQVLETSSSHKKARKVYEVLHKICYGLIKNEGLKLKDLMTFVFAVTTESLPQIAIKEPEDKARVEKPGAKPKSSLLITEEPKRGRNKPKVHSKSNMYVVVEFGLQVLYNLLKKSLLLQKKKLHLQMLDPFVGTITSCLASKHVKITTVSLRCLKWMLKFPLPSLKQHIDTITNHLFILLSNYAAPGAAKGDNFELTVICFKVVTVLVRDIHYHTITSEQLQVLLTYAEQDINDFTRQATAFMLLRAILSRKLIVPEIKTAIKRIQELSILSDNSSVRLQCRRVVLKYLMDYPIGRQLQQHLEFYVTHLQYEAESGRESALEMLAKIFTDFPATILARYPGLLFVPLSSRLVNDLSANCQKLTALVIKTYLSRLDYDPRDRLLCISIEWLESHDALIRKLAAKVLGIFVDVDSSSVTRKINELLPHLEQDISPEKYPEEMFSDDSERVNDRHLYVMLNLLLKLCRECDIIRRQECAPVMKKIWGHVEKHLVYPHSWVRLCSAQLFGLLFGSWTPEELVKKATEQTQNGADDSVEREYIVDNFQEKLHTLCGLFGKQLASPVLGQDLADQVVKNSVFLAKVLKLLPKNEDLIKDEETGIYVRKVSEDNEARATVSWLLKRMCKEAAIEMAHAKNTIKRSSVFKWIAAIAIDLGPTSIMPYLRTMLQPLIREITFQKADEELKQLSHEVLEMIKGVVGLDVFTVEYAMVNKALSDKRHKWRQQRAISAVENPELAASKQIKRNLAKKEATKRKMNDHKLIRLGMKKPRKQ